MIEFETSDGQRHVHGHPMYFLKRGDDIIIIHNEEVYRALLGLSPEEGRHLFGAQYSELSDAEKSLLASLAMYRENRPEFGGEAHWGWLVKHGFRKRDSPHSDSYRASIERIVDALI